MARLMWGLGGTWCMHSVSRLFLFAILIAVHPVMAHNVVGAVFVTGDLLDGEIGFSNGDFAQAGVLVQLVLPDGRVESETETDEDGAFQFRLKAVQAYQVFADLGQGHAITLDVLPEDITLPGQKEKAPVLSSDQPIDKSAVQTSMSREVLAAEIEASVARQLRPLRRELHAMRTATRMSDILGGIGVIIGLCGIAAYWMASKKVSAESARNEQDKV